MPTNAELQYEWLAPKLSAPEREALDRIWSHLKAAEREVDRVRMVVPYEVVLPVTETDSQYQELRRFASGLFWATAQGPAGRTVENLGLSDDKLKETFTVLIDRLTRGEKAEAELALVDSSLARRPALAGAPNRAAAIERACKAAGEADLLRLNLSKAETAKRVAEDRLQQVVLKLAENRLDGYNELGQKLADSEYARDKALTSLRQSEASIASLRNALRTAVNVLYRIGAEGCSESEGVSCSAANVPEEDLCAYCRARKTIDEFLTPQGFPPEPLPKKEKVTLNFVCTNFPGPGNECVFVELENAEGEGISLGKWEKREDGLVALVIPVEVEKG